MSEIVEYDYFDLINELYDYKESLEEALTSLKHWLDIFAKNQKENFNSQLFNLFDMYSQVFKNDREFYKLVEGENPSFFPFRLLIFCKMYSKDSCELPELLFKQIQDVLNSLCSQITQGNQVFSIFDKKYDLNIAKIVLLDISYIVPIDKPIFDVVNQLFRKGDKYYIGFFFNVYKNEEFLKFVDSIPKDLCINSQFVRRLPTKTQIAILNTLSQEELNKLINKGFISTLKGEEIALLITKLANPCGISIDNANLLAGLITDKNFTEEVCSFFNKFSGKITLKPNANYDYSVHPLFFMKTLRDPCSVMPPDLISNTIRSSNPFDVGICINFSTIVSEALETEEFWISYAPFLKNNSQNVLTFNMNVKNKAFVLKKILLSNNDNSDLFEFVRDITSSENIQFSIDDIIEIIKGIGIKIEHFWDVFKYQKSLYDLINEYEKYKDIVPYYFIRVLFSVQSSSYFPCKMFDINIKPFQSETQSCIINCLKNNEELCKDETTYQIEAVASLFILNSSNEKLFPHIHGVTNENSLAILAFYFSFCRELYDNEKIFATYFDRNPLSVFDDKDYKLTDFDLKCICSIIYFVKIKKTIVPKWIKKLLEKFIRAIIEKRCYDWIDGIDQYIWSALCIISHYTYRDFIVENEEIIKNWVLTKFTFNNYEDHISFYCSEQMRITILSLLKSGNSSVIKFIKNVDTFSLFSSLKLKEKDIFNQPKDFLTQRQKIYTLNTLYREDFQGISAEEIFDIFKKCDNSYNVSSDFLQVSNILFACFEHLIMFNSILHIEKYNDSTCIDFSSIEEEFSYRHYDYLEDIVNSFSHYFHLSYDFPNISLFSYPKQFPKSNEFERQLAELIIRDAYKTHNLIMMFIVLNISWCYPQLFMELDGLSPNEVGNMILDLCEFSFDIYDSNHHTLKELGTYPYAILSLYRLTACPVFIDEFIIPMISKMFTLSDSKLYSFLATISVTLSENRNIGILISVEFLRCKLSNLDIFDKHRYTVALFYRIINSIIEYIGEMGEDLYYEIITKKTKAQDIMCGHYLHVNKGPCNFIFHPNLLDIGYYFEDMIEVFSLKDVDYLEEEENTLLIDFIFDYLEKEEIIPVPEEKVNSLRAKFAKEGPQKDDVLKKILFYKPPWIKGILEGNNYVSDKQYEIFNETYNEYIASPVVEKRCLEEAVKSSDFIELLLKACQNQRFISSKINIKRDFWVKLLIPVMKEKSYNGQIDMYTLIYVLHNLSTLNGYEKNFDDEFANKLFMTIYTSPFANNYLDYINMFSRIAENPTKDFIIIFKILICTNANKSIMQFVSHHPKLLEAVKNAVNKKIKNAFSVGNEKYIECAITFMHSIINIDRKILLNYLDKNLQMMKNIPLISTLCNLFINNPQRNNEENIDKDFKNFIYVPYFMYRKDPEFWKIIEKNGNNLYNLFVSNPDVLNINFNFLKYSPKIIPFQVKVSHLYEQLSKRNAKFYKIIVRRNNILEDSFMQLKGINSPIKLSVSFIGEEGVDAGGVLKDWITTIIPQIFNTGNALFETKDGIYYQPSVFSSVDPLSIQYYELVGKIIAIAIISHTHINVHLKSNILSFILGYKLSIMDIKAADESLYNSLLWILNNDVTDCGLTFTDSYEYYGEIKTYELKQGGANIPVTNENKKEYANLILKSKLFDRIYPQICAIKKGFNSQIPQQYFSYFLVNEIEYLICSVPEIDIDDLEANTKITEPYTKDTKVIKFFFSAIRKWSKEDLKKLLVFWTGTGFVPIFGFSYLDDAHKMTISKLGDVERFPESHTCFNVLMLPEYESEKEVDEKLKYAVRECNTFGFI